MKRKEIIVKSIGLIGVSYPNNFKDFDKTKFELLIETWIDALEEFPEIELLPKATKKAIAKSEFPPSLKSIMDEFKNLYSGGFLPSNEYWEEMINYLSNYNHYGQQPEISLLTRRIIGKLGGSYYLRQMDIKQLYYIKNDFHNIYKEEIDKIVKNKILGIEEQIEQKSNIPLLETKEMEKKEIPNPVDSETGIGILKKIIWTK